MTAAARLEGVGKRYGRGAWALREVTLAAAPGAVTALVGANGSGKSTLLRVVAGELAADEGSVALFGAPAGALRGAALRRQVGLVGQDPAVDPDMTGDEFLRFFGALYGLGAAVAAERIGRLAAALDLAAVLGKPLGRVSGGQRQRVHLAAGLLQAPPLLLFDEPTNGLDPALRGAFWAELAAYCAGGRAAVVATHDLAGVAENAAAVAVLSQGRLVALGAPAELLARTGKVSLDAAYHALTGESLAPPAPGAGRGPGRGQGRGRA